MLTRQIDGATLYYQPADEEAVADLERLYAGFRRVLWDDWQLAATRHLKIRLITSWHQLTTGGRISEKVVQWYLLPLRWYACAFVGIWRHFKSNAWVRSSWNAKRKPAGLNVKAWRAFPPGLPLQLRGSYERDEPDVDHVTSWRVAVCRSLLEAWFADRYPQWVVIGLCLSVGRKVIDFPWYQHQDLQPILRYAGMDLKALDLRKWGRYSQDEIDEICARIQWQRFVIDHLRVEHAEALRDVLAFNGPPQRFNEHLAERLGLPAEQLFSSLADRIQRPGTQHSEQPAAGPAPDPPPSGVQPVEPSDNPYASPTASVPAGTSLATKLVSSVVGIVIALAVYSLFVVPALFWQWKAVPIILGLVAGGWLGQVLVIACLVLVNLARGVRYGGPK